VHQWCSGAGGSEHAHGEIKPDGHHSGLLDLAAEVSRSAGQIDDD